VASTLSKGGLIWNFDSPAQTLATSENGKYYYITSAGNDGATMFNGPINTQLKYKATSYTPAWLITFTIDNNSYNAKDGMTFGEWINSEYNTVGFIEYNNMIFYPTYDGSAPTTPLYGKAEEAGSIDTV
jgi:hypothetical protein